MQGGHPLALPSDRYRSRACRAGSLVKARMLLLNRGGAQGAIREPTSEREQSIWTRGCGLPTIRACCRPTVSGSASPAQPFSRSCDPARSECLISRRSTLWLYLKRTPLCRDRASGIGLMDANWMLVRKRATSSRCSRKDSSRSPQYS